MIRNGTIELYVSRSLLRLSDNIGERATQMKLVIRSFGLCLLWLVGSAAMADESHNETPQQERLIPLSEIVATSPQKELSHADSFIKTHLAPDAARSATGYLRQITNPASGASNIFLVDAKDFGGVLNATASVVLGSRTAGTPAPVNMTKASHGTYWLVCYLGVGPSHPTWWTVDIVSVADKKFIVKFRETHRDAGSNRDANPYFYWIPAGALAPGNYELELFDTGRQQTSLMRCVEVRDSK